MNPFAYDEDEKAQESRYQELRLCYDYWYKKTYDAMLSGKPQSIVGFYYHRAHFYLKLREELLVY